MSITTTAIKSLASFTVIPGSFMTAMGLGLAPLDQNIMEIAAPFIAPLGIPFQPFILVLGSCKIMGALSLWGKGPMSKSVGMIGLAIASICAAYGHYTVGESFIPPIVYLGLLGSL